MKELSSIIFLTTIFYLFIILPKFNFYQKEKLFLKDIHLYLINNLIIFLCLINLFSILRLDLNIVIFFFILLILINLINKFDNYYLFFKNNIKKLLFIFFLVFLFNLQLSSNLELGFDGQAIWYEKTYFIFKGLDPINATMNEYPFFGSYLWAYFWKLSTLDFEHYGRFSYILVFLITIVSIFLIYSEKNNIGNYLFLSLIVFFIFENNFIFNGYQDILVFTLLLIFMHYFISFHKNKLTIDLVFLYLTSFILSWTKNEANIYCCVLLFVLGLIQKDKNFLLLNLLVVFLIFIHKMLIYKYYFQIDMGLQPGNYSIKSILSYEFEGKILLYILFSFIKVFFKNIIIIIMMPLIIFYLMNKKIFSEKQRKTIFTCMLSFSFLICVMISFYIFTSMPLKWHLSTSLERLIFQVSSILIYPSIIILNKLTNNIKIN
jgi:hypothetical protein